MKVTCKKADLSRSLAIVGRAIGTKSTLPILSNVLLEVCEGRLRMSASNLELAIQCTVDATIEQGGRTTLPAKVLTDFVNFLPHESITLETEENGCLVSSQVSSAILKMMDPEEFPRMPTMLGTPSLVVDASQFKTMIEDAGFAASHDEGRPALTGIYLEVEGNTLLAASADAFRLATAKVTLSLECTPVSLLVPAKTLRDVAAILPEQGQVAISLDKGQVLFHTESIDVAARLLEGPYVKFRQMIPQEYHLRAEIETRLFSSILKTAALFARESDHCVCLTFRPGESNVVVEAKAELLGMNKSPVVATYDGKGDLDELTMLFNVRYLAEALAAMSDAASFAFELCTQNRPAILKPVETRDVLYVVMPLQRRK